MGAAVVVVVKNGPNDTWCSGFKMWSLKEVFVQPAVDRESTGIGGLSIVRPPIVIQRVIKCPATTPVAAPWNNFIFNPQRQFINRYYKKCFVFIKRWRSVWFISAYNKFIKKYTSENVAYFIILF